MEIATGTCLRQLEISRRHEHSARLDDAPGGDRPTARPWTGEIDGSLVGPDPLEFGRAPAIGEKGEEEPISIQRKTLCGASQLRPVVINSRAFLLRARLRV